MNFDTPIWGTDNLKREVIKLKKLMRFLKDEEGVTAIEYGLIAALIAVVIIVAVATIVAKRLGKGPGDGERSG